MKLTKDQERGEQAFYQFLNTQDKTFVLSGGAGVGKTTLMGHFHRVTLERYQQACDMLGIKSKFESVLYAATTNKAADVLEKTLGVPVKTIHSTIGLKVVPDYKTGVDKLQRTQGYQQRTDLLLFIDESSMIDTFLYKEILEAFPKCKIVFVGDHAQMAPVNERLSPVYEHVDEKNFVFLSEPVRNAEKPALVALCEQLRETVETGTFYPIEEVPGVIEHLDPNQMQEKLNEYFKDPGDKTARVLTYTNPRAILYNAYMREIRNLPSTIQVGDEVVVAQAFARGKTILNVERELVIHDMDPQPRSAGYEGFFSDGQGPLMYYQCDAYLKNFPDNIFTLPVAADPVRLNLGIKAAARAKNWDAMYGMKGACADLRGKDACTVYKSQGSTYDAAFIDLTDIGKSRDPEQVARMLFVAASRARSNVYLFGELPPEYQGTVKWMTKNSTLTG